MGTSVNVGLRVVPSESQREWIESVPKGKDVGADHRAEWRLEPACSRFLIRRGLQVGLFSVTVYLENS